MAHRSLGGWLIPNRLFLQLKVANELWYFSRKDGSNERQVSLFFVGWYDQQPLKAKLFTIIILWLSFQAGISINNER